MSADISHEKLGRFIAKHSEKELRILMLFKVIKTMVVSALEKHRRPRVDRERLDEYCLEKAKKLAVLGKEPSEEDIRNLVDTLLGER